MFLAKTSLEVTNEKLGAELEKARQRLVSKMKELEPDIIQKNSSLSELRLRMREASEKEERAQRVTSQLQDQAKVKKMKKELENFDPTFFEEIEDLQFNYNLEVKKNIVLEEQLKKVSEQFGVAAADIPDMSIS
ncbi:unnamed protein product [Coregonus sp. 'balchen']|nr:unnamed protein product [Coregonus sp. 'balchen']